MGQPDTQSSPQAKPLSPKMALLLGNAADSASTYTFLKAKMGKERNPAMSFFNEKPWTVIPTGIAANYGYSKLYDMLHKRKPKIADAIAGLVGGWHGALAGNNMERVPGWSFDEAATDLSPVKGTR